MHLLGFGVWAGLSQWRLYGRVRGMRISDQQHFIIASRTMSTLLISIGAHFSRQMVVLTERDLVLQATFWAGVFNFWIADGSSRTVRQRDQPVVHGKAADYS